MKWCWRSVMKLWFVESLCVMSYNCIVNWECKIYPNLTTIPSSINLLHFLSKLSRILRLLSASSLHYPSDSFQCCFLFYLLSFIALQVLVETREAQEPLSNMVSCSLIHPSKPWEKLTCTSSRQGLSRMDVLQVFLSAKMLVNVLDENKYRVRHISPAMLWLFSR